MGTPPPIPLPPIYLLHILQSLPAHRTLHALFCVYVLHVPVSFGAQTLHGWMLGVKGVQSLSFALIVPKLNIWVA